MVQILLLIDPVNKPTWYLKKQYLRLLNHLVLGIWHYISTAILKKHFFFKTSICRHLLSSYLNKFTYIRLKLIKTTDKLIMQTGAARSQIWSCEAFESASLGAVRMTALDATLKTSQSNWLNRASLLRRCFSWVNYEFWSFYVAVRPITLWIILYKCWNINNNNIYLKKYMTLINTSYIRHPTMFSTKAKYVFII